MQKRLTIKRHQEKSHIRKNHNTVQKTEYAVGKRTQKNFDLQFQTNMHNNICQR